MGTLQEQIKKTSKAGLLELQHGCEFQESIKIDKAITIRSTDIPITIIGGSPTITIESKGVVLENVQIENNEDDGVCLSVKKGCDPRFNNVFLKGKVQGLEDEEGEWQIPKVLELAIKPGKVTKNRFIVFSPIPAKIYPSGVDVITCDPKDLRQGINEIDIVMKEIPEGSFISGDLVIETIKYKLKRRISIHGNTLNAILDSSMFNGKLIWTCKAASFIKIPDNLIPANQGEQYEYIFKDDKGVEIEKCNITVSGLPDGISIDSSLVPLKIKGIPKAFGEFNLNILLEKDGIAYKYTSHLHVEERKIIPLKLTSIPAPIKVNENEMINIKFDILSSNSQNIKFNIISALPEGLNFNDNTREMWGKVARHGKYHSVFQVTDGTNTVTQDVNFLIYPKEPLTIDFQKRLEVFKDEEFSFPVNINDNKRLSANIQLKNCPPGLLSTEPTSDGFLIRGKLTEVKNYDIQFEIEDIYGRRCTETVFMICKEKPKYTIKWLTNMYMDKIGKKGSQFDTPIEAKILEKPYDKLEFIAMKKLPDGWQLSKDGFLKIFIDGNVHIIKIQVKYNEFVWEQEFTIRTSIDSSVTLSMDTDKMVEKDIWKKHSPKIEKEPEKIETQSASPEGESTGKERKSLEKSAKEEPATRTSSISSKSSKIISGDGFGKAFQASKSADDVANDLKLNIKNRLNDGKINLDYKDRIFFKKEDSFKNLKLKVESLPDGLKFNSSDFTIEGIPKIMGDYTLIIHIIDHEIVKEVKLLIKSKGIFGI